MKVNTAILLSVVSASFLLEPVAYASSGDNDSREITEMGLELSSGREMQIREPSMCDGEAEAKLSWNKDDNELEIEGEFEGLPYREDYCYDYDPSSDYNDYPLCVEGDDGQGNIGVQQSHPDAAQCLLNIVFANAGNAAQAA